MLKKERRRTKKTILLEQDQNPACFWKGPTLLKHVKIPLRFHVSLISPMVERLAGNLEVPGSNPGQGSYVKTLWISFLIEDEVAID